MSDWQLELDEHIDGIAGRLSAIRRHLHAHPEPSGEEFETTRYLAELLREQGFDVRIPETGRGLVAEPGSQPSDRRIAFRGDIDALKLRDEKQVEYRSTIDGVTHACGHDSHATIVVATALALDACKDALPWPVPWRAIFQPAEETSTGAQEMVDSGAMQDVRSIVALHVDPERHIGRIGYRHGTMTAFCDEIDVWVRGEGGHAARPHHSVDSIAAACQFISAVHQFVPRAIDSRQAVVITFGSIHGGSAQNVIPEEVHIRGTARTHSHAATSKLEERIEEIADGISEATGAEIEVAFKRGPEAVVNDDTVTDAVIEAATALLGAEALETIDEPSMGGEDFAEYLGHAPGCLFRLGVSQNPAKASFLHSPRFDLDEEALAIGAKLMTRAVILLARTQD